MIVAQIVRDPSRLNKMIEFGTVHSIENANGIDVPTFVSLDPPMNVHCAIWKRTINQAYSLLGTEKQDNTTVIIRHNININNALHAKINNVEYEIIDIISDETSNIIKYDVVILKKVTR